MLSVKVKDGRCSPVLDTVYSIYIVRESLSAYGFIKSDMLVLWNPCCGRWANLIADANGCTANPYDENKDEVLIV